MTTMISVLVSALLLIGCLFVAAAGLGLVRFPDVYCRMHSTSKASTLGVFSIMLSAFIFFLAAGFGLNSQSLLVIVFIFLTSPVGAHMIAKSAYHYEVELWAGTVYDELNEYYSEGFDIEDGAEAQEESFGIEFDE